MVIVNLLLVLEQCLNLVIDLTYVFVDIYHCLLHLSHLFTDANRLSSNCLLLFRSVCHLAKFEWVSRRRLHDLVRGVHGRLRCSHGVGRRTAARAAFLYNWAFFRLKEVFNSLHLINVRLRFRHEVFGHRSLGFSVYGFLLSIWGCGQRSKYGTLCILS